MEMTVNKKLLAVALSTLALLVACGGSGDDEDEDQEEAPSPGAQCQPCRTGANRCDPGLTCSVFMGGGRRQELCASPSTTQCTVAP